MEESKSSKDNSSPNFFKPSSRDPLGNIIIGTRNLINLLIQDNHADALILSKKLSDQIKSIKEEENIKPNSRHLFQEQEQLLQNIQNGMRKLIHSTAKVASFSGFSSLFNKNTFLNEIQKDHTSIFERYLNILGCIRETQVSVAKPLKFADPKLLSSKDEHAVEKNAHKPIENIVEENLINEITATPAPPSPVKFYAPRNKLMTREEREELQKIKDENTTKKAGENKSSQKKSEDSSAPLPTAFSFSRF